MKKDNYIWCLRRYITKTYKKTAEEKISESIMVLKNCSKSIS